MDLEPAETSSQRHMRSVAFDLNKNESLKKIMDSSAIGSAGTILGVVDLAAIAGVFFYLNNRINTLEKGMGYSPTSGLNNGNSGSPAEKAETRIARLEDEIEILLERLDAYDKLFAKLMYSMKEISMHGENQVGSELFKPYRSNIRRRPNTLLEFKDTEGSNPSKSKNTQEENPEDESEEAMFSFLT